MPCARCQHENRPQATFCEACGTPLTAATPSSPPAPSYADLKREVERLGGTLTEAPEQQKTTAELLEVRSRELAEAHEQQTATAEILRVISGSPTDVRPVFTTILDKAMALVGAQLGVLWRYDGDELFRAVEVRGAGPEWGPLLRTPQRFGRPIFRPIGPWKS